MSKRSRFAAVLLSLLLAVSLCAAPCLASDEGYTYTVTLYAGNHATFSDGSDTMTFAGLKAGDIVNFSDVLSGGIQLDDSSKYYIRGVRLSGRDNNTVATTAFPVTGDAQYVVAYGIQGEMVAYTVTYEDANGNALLPARTFYGNVTDKPVVAFQYVEGYQPQAYNLTKTLSSNTAENVFNFVYNPIPVPAAPTPTATPTPTPTPSAAATEAPAPTENTGTEPATPETETETTEPAAPTEPVAQESPAPVEEPAVSAAPEPETVPEETETPAEPEELIDLDEQEVPLAEAPEAEDGTGTDGAAANSESGGLSTGAVVGISAGAVAVAALCVVLAVVRRKSKKKR